MVSNSWKNPMFSIKNEQKLNYVLKEWSSFTGKGNWMCGNQIYLIKWQAEQNKIVHSTKTFF